MILFTGYFIVSCLSSLTEANSTHSPRMVFTEKDIAMKRVPLPGDHVPVQIVLGGEPDTVTAAGPKNLVSFNFQNPQETPVERNVLWEECSDNTLQQRDCQYNVTMVHKREEDNQVFVCGTDGLETVCCNMNLSEQSPQCIPSEEMENIKRSVRAFVIKEGEPSTLVESTGHVDLYITNSRSPGFVGIHKFGRHRVGPANQDKEQQYVGLVLSRRKDTPLQDRVYAFYKEKNRDKDLYSEMWFPFVTQVCTADIGGPRNTLQFTWTSQMNARLFCGDSDSRQHFSELVDVATVHADRWQDTRVYALFRNEWGMSAVCVYTIQGIDNIFTTSPFKDEKSDRSRMCVPDSTKIPVDTLRNIEHTSEMKNWVHPVDNLGPVFLSHHSYTHIYVDSSRHRGNDHHPVLFLSQKNGGIHKMIMNESQAFVIAEYRPFNHRTPILNIILHPSSRKLYVNSRSDLVQLDLTNCTHYGDSCEDCVIARDPYCGWNGIHCTHETGGTVQDVAQGNHNICKSLTAQQFPVKAYRYSGVRHAAEDMDTIRLPSHSRYFLQCPVSSHHAQYTWEHPGSSTSCSSKEQQCLLLIDSMGPEQVGTYRCVSEEMGYSKVLAQYQLQLENTAAGHSAGPLLWVCLLAVLILSLSC